MKKALLAMGVAGVLVYNVPVTTAKAISTEEALTYTDEVQPRTAGLIRSYDLTVSTSGGHLYMNGYTISSSSMSSIGYTNIVIEYSSDNIHWYVENSNIADLLKSGRSYYLNNHELDVDGGYYYRVSCNHYAERSNGSSQSVANTSNSVWIN